jgi:hypothetical protein
MLLYHNSSPAPAIMYDAFTFFNRALFGGRIQHVRLELRNMGTNAELFHGAKCYPDKIALDEAETWNGSALNCLILVHEQTHLDVGIGHGHDSVWRRRMESHGLWFNEADVEYPAADGKFVKVFNLFAANHGIDIYGRRVAA